MKAVEIRLAKADDAELIAEMGARTFLAAFGGQNDAQQIEKYVGGAFSVEQIRAELLHPKMAFFLAYRGQVPVAYAKLAWGKVPECVKGPRPIELERIYVEPNHIGTGIGSAMFAFCIGEVERRGFQTIWLGVWEENRKAIRFYAKNGFQMVGAHTFMMGDEPQEDKVMQRPVRTLQAQ